MTKLTLDDDIVNAATDNITYLEEQMNDDFNTANALSSWYDLVRITNVYTERDTVNKETFEMLKASFETYRNIRN